MKSVSITNDATLIQVAKVLSNQKRVTMLTYLDKNKWAMVSSFTRMLKIPTSDASKNLKVMRECGLVKREKIGKRWVHSLNQQLWKAVLELQKASRA